ncbi:hypothetical protein BJ508DRAFT_331888 [Ascobolus immersus RN42]|uniref:Uncharacterized protein n=1 Tax=Ascobolus immersus RN42 TaxID=1160509 RepID=A0A3N4HRR8_ASCIM|nr:hypothetical protein BJ508DRAFT_331888 [Ascobolus immersus RN42]
MPSENETDPPSVLAENTSAHSASSLTHTPASNPPASAPEDSLFASLSSDAFQDSASVTSSTSSASLFAYLNVSEDDPDEIDAFASWQPPSYDSLGPIPSVLDFHQEHGLFATNTLINTSTGVVRRKKVEVELWLKGQGHVSYFPDLQKGASHLLEYAMCVFGSEKVLILVKKKVAPHTSQTSTPLLYCNAILSKFVGRGDMGGWKDSSRFEWVPCTPKVLRDELKKAERGERDCIELASSAKNGKELKVDLFWWFILALMLSRMAQYKYSISDDSMSFDEKTAVNVVETVVPTSVAPLTNLEAFWLENGILNDVPKKKEAPTYTIKVVCFLRPRPALIVASSFTLPIYNRNLKGFTTKEKIKPYDPRDPGLGDGIAWDENNYRCSFWTVQAMKGNPSTTVRARKGTTHRWGVKVENIVGLYRNGVAYSIDQHERIYNMLIDEGYRREGAPVPAGGTTKKAAEFIILFEPPAHFFQKMSYKSNGRVYLSRADCQRLKRDGCIEAPVLIDGIDGGKTVIHTIEGLGKQ